MLHDLSRAREIATSIKFSYETDKSDIEYFEQQSKNLRELFYSNELLISKEITPILYESLQNVLIRLSVPSKSVIAFVYPSPEFNASCHLSSDQECIIRFSSSLIDLLSTKEFEFVVGHEIGHFLLNHSNNTTKGSLEDLINVRAQEISADRLGFMGCKSLKVAIKALIKSASGLNDTHLKFDVGSFISQLGHVSKNSSIRIDYSHPSILIRCRALLWFSLNNSYSKKALLNIDAKIKKDMDLYTNSSVNKIIEEAKDNFSMWMSAYNIVQKQFFSKEDQNKFQKRYGSDILTSLLNLINDLDKIELEKTIYEHLKNSREVLENLIPGSFEKEVARIDFI